MSIRAYYDHISLCKTIGRSEWQSEVLALVHFVISYSNCVQTYDLLLQLIEGGKFHFQNMTEEFKSSGTSSSKKVGVHPVNDNLS
jgi:hypothetical protein